MIARRPVTTCERFSFVEICTLSPTRAIAASTTAVSGVADSWWVATDAGFIDVIAETTASQPGLTFDTLANGTYFARFTAIDGVGLEGIPAAYAFERRLNALGLDTPDAVAGMGRQYRFKWRSSGGGTESFRFTLARDADGGRAVIDEAGLSGPQIVVTDLPAGVYFWRVLVSRREGGKLYEKWSQPQRFEIGG